MCWSETVTLAKDVALTGAAITGAIVAVKGLSAWRTQLRGHSDYDLSRRLLVTLFRYRDSLNAVRHPVMWANEMPMPPAEKVEAMSRDQIQYYGRSGAYQKRWDGVREQRTSLYADILEAEALWGSEVKVLFKKLFDLEHELAICIRHYLEVINPDTDQDSREAVQDIRRTQRDILYDDLSDDGDEFRKEILAAIGEIEKYLKPKLVTDGA